ncbi:LysR family transcriptional regulator [Oharaeibacter diazotrophicus]|uniref:DNA-binding transcriptional LysR family regulator n=1 Tax=Oharaeibacter diazotrophicus TaxID=1920512 RepID=A0A4R6RA00_9HYPH|nr:LysR family transcriptional regulator [Oharaeibacter diazotrophicus]TDP82447.1 DNA-binding transcriptional LysR family regulator [Oharaeibacter diazotrophicus]BBE72790.1 LysR family transcriptional regulator [Pleomorphomonas sp. SM30]GLS76828.1 LysR family transcriptional regulator [Oharaeibacter diazotrophicus]
MLDKLELLLNLARERHFGRAAEAAGVTQPTLSSAVKSLEEQFGVMIVVRGSRFQGFTPEGERILEWSRRLVTDARTMRQEVAALRQGLTGTLRLAVIPTALPFVAEITGPICGRHERVGFTVLSMTSDQILKSIEDFEVEAGITYLDAGVAARFAAVPLYEERYSLLVAPGGPLADRASVSWAEAGAMPLCLLTPDMQHRRLVERHLGQAGAAVAPRIESNSMIVLHTHVRTGRFASIMPARFAESMDRSGLMQAIPITEPTVSHAIGLVTTRREPQAPLVAALIAEARRHADPAPDPAAAARPGAA